MSTPFRQTAPSKNCWELTDDRISHLNACAAQGMPLAAAARELGVRDNTIRAAAHRQFKSEWLAEKFPSRRGQGGQRCHEMAERKDEIRRLKPEQIDAPLVVPNSPQTRWLTRSWAA